MLAYMARRLGLAVFTIWIITLFGFLVIQLPEGDAIDRYLDLLELGGGGEHMNSEKIAQNLRAYAGYDQPMPVRYGKWMWNMMHGDLGRSFLWYQGDFPQETPVKELVGDRIWTTVALSAFTILVTWTLAIPIGIYSAVRQHTIGDYVFTLIGFSGLAVPDFLLGLVLMYVAFAYFGQSVGGLFSPDFKDAAWGWPKAWDMLKHLWIPAVVLGTSGTAGLIRVMRNNLLDELEKPYVVTARAKGMPRWRTILKYPTRVAINPLVSTVGYLLPALVSGSIIVSVVLSLPTLGPVLLFSIRQQDVYTAGFIVLMLGVMTVIGTLISDILLAVVDPRIKLTGR
jgi:peptide/nickel transport system permease protein